MKLIKFKCDHHFHSASEEEEVNEKIIREIPCEQKVCIERIYTYKMKCCICSKVIKRKAKYVLWEKRIAL